MTAVSVPLLRRGLQCRGKREQAGKDTDQTWQGILRAGNGHGGLVLGGQMDRRSVSAPGPDLSSAVTPATGQKALAKRGALVQALAD